MNKVRAGVIGVGHMGHYHVGAYMEVHYVDLVGVADTDETRAGMISEQYDVKKFADYRDLLPLVDVVTVAVPTKEHFQVAKDALEAGVHVLVEKPIATNIEDARELFRLADDKGVALHVGHVERYNAAVQELMKIVTEPLLVETRRLGPFVKRVQDDGVVLDLMIHDIDIVLGLVRSEVVNIEASGLSRYTDRGDVAVVNLTFESGCVATLTASRVTQNKIRTMAVSQEDFYVFLNFTEQDLHIHRQASSEAKRTRHELRYRQSSIIEQVFVHKENPLKLEIVDLINCAMNHQCPMVSVDRELKSLEIALEIEDILKNKGIIRG
jgi:predicted dehydrogenase